MTAAMRGRLSARIYVLSLVSFASGSGAFAFAGLLEPMAADLGVSTATAGQLQTAYVLASALLGPPAAQAMARFDRKSVILMGLGLAFGLHLACALAPDFAGLIVRRSLAGLAAAIAAPAASVAAASLAPSERRGSAVAAVSAGLTLAFIVGIPSGSVIGALFGWRATFLFAAGLAGAALIAVALGLPRIRPAPKRATAALPVVELWPLYLTTLLAFAPTMVLNLYIGPIVRAGAGATGTAVGLFQAAIGLGSLAGLLLGGRAADRQTGRQGILGGFLVQAVAILVLLVAAHRLTPTGWPTLALVALAAFTAAAAIFTIMPQVQAGLIRVGEGAPVVMALNSSLTALGQAVGASVGGAGLALGGVSGVLVVALALNLVGVSVLRFALPPVQPAGGC